MEIIYLLIPISLILLGLIVWILLWAVRDGQYDDLEGPAYRILMDEDKIVERDVELDNKTEKIASQKNSRRGGAG
jgi:cbb3-type cytochrome oxidase maturation protein